MAESARHYHPHPDMAKVLQACFDGQMSTDEAQVRLAFVYLDHTSTDAMCPKALDDWSDLYAAITMALHVIGGLAEVAHNLVHATKHSAPSTLS